MFVRLLSCTRHSRDGSGTALAFRTSGMTPGMLVPNCKVQINKTDQNDAGWLAQIIRAAWYRSVRVKSFDSQWTRVLLSEWAQLVPTIGGSRVVIQAVDEINPYRDFDHTQHRRAHGA